MCSICHIDAGVRGIFHIRKTPSAAGDRRNGRSMFRRLMVCGQPELNNCLKDPAGSRYLWVPWCCGTGGALGKGEEEEVYPSL